MKTPVNYAAVARFRQMTALDATVRAWTDPGNHPDAHRRAQDQVRDLMPLLADSLDRLAQARSGDV